MGLIPRANTAAFLDPNLLSQRLEELYAGSKPAGPPKDDGAVPPAQAAGAADGRGAAGPALDARGAALPVAFDPLMQRAALVGGPPRQAYVGAIKKRVSCHVEKLFMIALPL